MNSDAGTTENVAASHVRVEIAAFTGLAWLVSVAVAEWPKQKRDRRNSVRLPEPRCFSEGRKTDANRSTPKPLSPPECTTAGSKELPPRMHQ